MSGLYTSSVSDMMRVQNTTTCRLSNASTRFSTTPCQYQQASSLVYYVQLLVITGLAFHNYTEQQQ
jgi:hypothetical protein